MNLVLISAYSTFITLFLGISVLGQENLVPNHDFENHPIECLPELYLQNVDSWFVPEGGGTTDYFNSCSNEEWGGIGVPENNHGFQFANSGEGYIGFSTWAEGYDNVNELLRVQLTETLDPGVEYEVSCYLSLAEVSSLSTDSLHFLFTSDDFSVWNNEENMRANESQVVFEGLDTINDNEWAYFHSYFVAQGDEVFLTIGDLRFDDDIDTTWIGANSDVIYSYYYIEDIQVRKRNTGILEYRNACDVFPTIASDRITLRCKEIPERIDILSLDGKLIERLAAPQFLQHISVNGWRKSTYLVRFNYPTEIIIKRFVIGE